MAISRVNKKNMAANGASYSFNGGTCDCAIVKTTEFSAGVTYGGMAMTKLTEVADTRPQTFQIWGLQNAPSGTVTVSGMSTINSIETYSGVSGSATFPNVSGTAEHHFGSGSLTGIQIDLITTENNCVIVSLGSYTGSGLTYMQPGGDATLISVDPPSGGENLSMESNPLDLGVTGLKSISASTGGGSNSIAITLSAAALSPGPSVSTQSTIQAIII